MTIGKVIDTCEYDAVQTIAKIAAECAPLSRAALTTVDADRIATALKVLADPARPGLLSLIQAQHDGEACVCHLQQPRGLSQPTMSHHLKVLVDTGLLEREQRGRWAYFRVIPEPLAAIRDLLA